MQQTLTRTYMQLRVCVLAVIGYYWWCVARTRVIDCCANIPQTIMQTATTSACIEDGILQLLHLYTYIYDCWGSHHRQLNEAQLCLAIAGATYWWIALQRTPASLPAMLWQLPVVIVFSVVAIALLADCASDCCGIAMICARLPSFERASDTRSRQCNNSLCCKG